MRPGHNLDVYEVVEMIEKMYNNLKADIELNTPDSYTSITNQRRGNDDKDNKVGGFDMSKLESLATKLKGFDNGKLEGLTKKAEGAVHGAHESEKQLEDEIEHFKGDAVREVERRKTDLDREAREREARARAAVNEGKQAVRDGVEGQRSQLDSAVRDSKARLDNAVNEHHARTLRTIDDTGRLAQEEIEHTSSHASGSITSLVREISDIHRTAVTGGRAAAAHQIRQLAHRLAGHEEKPEEHSSSEEAEDHGKQK